MNSVLLLLIDKDRSRAAAFSWGVPRVTGQVDAPVMGEMHLPSVHMDRQENAQPCHTVRAQANTTVPFFVLHCTLACLPSYCSRSRTETGREAEQLGIRGAHAAAFAGRCFRCVWLPYAEE